MQDIAPQLHTLLARGESFALASVIAVAGSAPRDAGAAVAVTESGEVFGSISGGCVEGAVYELAREVLETGEPALQRYGYSDSDAFAVGLTCGGVLDVFLRPVRADRGTAPPATARALLSDVLDAVAGGEPAALATVVSGPPHLVGNTLAVTEHTTTHSGGYSAAGTLGSSTLDWAVTEDVGGLLAHGATTTRKYGPLGQRLGTELTVFVQSFAPPPRMLVFGAIDFASALARLGKQLGYHVTVCDARPVFTTRQRFPDADEVVVDWPHRYLSGTVVDARTVVCVLTHDEKFDIPLLELALRGEAGYVGAMGSRRTHEQRQHRLRQVGLRADELARLRSPIGLDIGARTPEETAVSIAAEFIACRARASGRPLSATRGPIHSSRIALPREGVPEAELSTREDDAAAVARTG